MAFLVLDFPIKSIVEFNVVAGVFFLEVAVIIDLSQYLTQFQVMGGGNA